MSALQIVIDYRQPAPLTRQELTFEDVGDSPLGVVKALCRALLLSPAVLTFDADPAARGRRDEQARAFAFNLAGQAVARIHGMSATWLTVSARVLGSAGWRPEAPQPPSAADQEQAAPC